MSSDFDVVKYGPFHRIKSPTQNFEVVALQLQSGELFGKPIKNGGNFPMVKAYRKPLCHPNAPDLTCANEEGIEFDTFVEPNKCTPGGTLYWSYSSGKRGMREVDYETIALTVNIYKVFYAEANSESVNAI